MKKIIVLSLAALGLMGCDMNLSGTFLLAQNMNIVNSAGQNVSLPAGRLQADFKVQDKKITVQIPSLSTGLIINMTKSQRKSLEKGRETLMPSSTSGQPFDVLAKITSRTLDSRTYYTTQTCTRYVYQTVCDQQGHCTTQAIPRMGWQHVQLIEEDVQSYANMSIFKTGTQELLSTASAETAVTTYTRNHYVSGCF